MSSRIDVLLATDATAFARLVDLQAAFSEACNALVPTVRETRCWNRVGLHHLAYRQLREAFPRLGSQMACNAIYSVSRVYREVATPPPAPLPVVKFLPGMPVFFDRHTLSLQNGHLSMFTLDGRMRFTLDLPPQEVALIARGGMREIILLRSGERFILRFILAEKTAEDDSYAEMLPTFTILLAAADAMPQPCLP
jgi:hypothetical protein